jgi:hypothetical protein
MKRAGTKQIRAPWRKATPIRTVQRPKGRGAPANRASTHWSGLVAVLRTLPDGHSRVAVVITMIVASAVVAVVFVVWRYLVWRGA